jgi:hypothetical protein
MSNPLVQPLNLTAHARLEKSLGYEYSRRWVAWHWEPDINQLMYSDGKNFGTGSALAWQVFLQHPQIAPQIQDYGLNQTEQYWLLLDRESRNLYIGEAKVIQNLLETPESLLMLAGLDGNSNFLGDTKASIQETVEKITQYNFLGTLKKLLPIAGAIGAIASVGIVAGLIPCQKFQTRTNITTNPVISVNSATPCGDGGTQDFSAYKNQNKNQSALHLIGIYEARGDHRIDYRPTGEVTVQVAKQKQPIVLALSAYEPVKWNIKAEPGAEISQIILNGYHDQQVVGVENVSVQEYSYEETGKYLGNFMYKWNASESQSPSSLVTKLEQLTGSQLTSFQGCYRGNQFQVK